ncbi:MAG: hypothetical protein AAF555_04770 [Verrucomicrobiota bacterium]
MPLFPRYHHSQSAGWLNDLRKLALDCLSQNELHPASLPQEPEHTQRPNLALWRMEDEARGGVWWVLANETSADLLHEDYPSDWDYILLKFAARLRNRAWHDRQSPSPSTTRFPEELEASARWMESLAMRS